MPRINAITESFAAGEISPFMIGRVSTEGYKQGVAFCENMFPDPRGPLLRRPGFLTQNTFLSLRAGKTCFQLGQNTAYDVTISETFLRITPNAFTRYDREMLVNGKFTNKQVAWIDDSANNGTVTYENDEAIFTVDETTAEATIFQALKTETAHVGTLHEIEIFGIFTGPNTSEGLELLVGTGSVGSSTLINHSLYDNVKYYKTTFTPLTTSIGITLKALPQTSRVAADVTKNFVFKIRVRHIDSTVTSTNVAHPYDVAELDEVHSVMSPTTGEMYFVHRNHTPRKLVFTAPATWTFNAVAFTAIPGEWGAANYPSTVDFFQGRSVWGGLEDNPETFWLSKSGNYEDMTIGPLAADGFKYKIAAHGLIKWVIGSKNLLVGTDQGEFTVTSESGIITPSDVQVDQQSAFGSSGVQPVKLGTEVLYVSPDGKKLRTMGYSWTDSGWISQDLTEASDHITDDPIVDIAYARNPHSIIWCVTQAGYIISCSYRHIGGKTPVIGWSRHQTNSRVSSISVMEDNGISVPWISSRRYSLTASEHTADRLAVEHDDVFTDGAIIQATNTPTDTITGLDHLDGLTVYPVVDGAVHPPVIVSSNQAVLDYAGNYIIIGTHSPARITTLPLVMYGQGNPLTHGTSRWSKIYLNIYKSAKPLIFGKRPPDRSPATLMNRPEALDTERYQVSSLGWDDGHLDIEQDVPLPLNITALSGEASVNTL